MGAHGNTQYLARSESIKQRCRQAAGLWSKQQGVFGLVNNLGIAPLSFRLGGAE